MYQPKCLEGDCKDGKGVIEYPFTGRYSGEFRNGNRHGTGTMKWDSGEMINGDGSKNEGIWEDDKLVKGTK